MTQTRPLTMLDRRVALAVTEASQGLQHLSTLVLQGTHDENLAVAGAASLSFERAALQIKGQSLRVLTMYEERLVTRAVEVALSSLPDKATAAVAARTVEATLKSMNKSMSEGDFVG